MALEESLDFLLRIDCRIGRRYAAVLPEPVLEWAELVSERASHCRMSYNHPKCPFLQALRVSLSAVQGWAQRISHVEPLAIDVGQVQNCQRLKLFAALTRRIQVPGHHQHSTFVSSLEKCKVGFSEIGFSNQRRQQNITGRVGVERHSLLPCPSA